MNKLVKMCVIFIVALTLFTHQAFSAGCVDNASCTHLCGFAGEGECVDGKYCKCAECPQRSIYELATVPKICTWDPTCLCPDPIRLSLTSGRIYSGHRCLYGTSLVCICFCMPTTPQSLLDVVKCPFPKGSGNSSSTTTTSTTTSAP